MRMTARILVAALGAALLLPATARSQGKWGAIAWVTVGGDYWSLGMSGNVEQQPGAEWEAKRECEPNDPQACHLALILENECGAAAVSEDPNLDLIHLGFGKAEDELTARSQALADCRDRGGPSCTIEVSGCSGGGTAPPDFRLDRPDCRNQPAGAQCWIELANQPGCYVWNPNRQPSETATWTGGCSAGLADGQGRLTWESPPDNRQEQDGMMRQGRPDGHSLIRDADGDRYEGPYVDGQRNGHWVQRFASGTVFEGPFRDGERNGHWVLRFANGNVGEGPYVDGKRNGHWVWHFPDGQVEQGPFVDDEQHGRWVAHPPDGDTFYVTFVKGVRQEP